MPETTLIYYSAAHPDHVTWSVMNDAGELTGKITEGTLEQAAETAKQSRTAVILDSTALSINRIQLPALNQQKLLKAIPFALEEYIADEIEDLHFVFTRIEGDERTAVVAIEKHRLDAILEQFTGAGIKVDRIIPDSICLAADSSQWCVLRHGDNTLFQSGTAFGGSYDDSTIDTIIGSELRDADKPSRIMIFDLEGGEPLAIDDIEGCETVHVTYNTHPLVIFSGNIRRASALNLLQHAYKPKNKNLVQWRRWGLAASLAFIWLAVSLGMKGYELNQLRQQNAATEQQIIDIYRSSFPESKRIVNARVQMEQKLNELRASGGKGGNSIISLLSSSSRAIAEERSLTLRMVTYRNDRLDLSFSSKNLKAIQDLNDKLNKTPGLKAEITSSSSEKDSVTGSIRVQAS